MTDTEQASSVPVSSDPADHFEADGRMKGNCKFWNHRGFGFIVPNDGSEDVFCHFNSITDGNCLTEGSKVSFNRVKDPVKGKFKAEDVTGGSTNEKFSKPEAPEVSSGTGPRVNGQVKRWNSDKGYGFIVPDDGTQDVFCHFSHIVDGDALQEGAKVQFTKIHDTKKGNYRAENLYGGFNSKTGAPPAAQPAYGGAYPSYGAYPPAAGGYGAPGAYAPPPGAYAPPPGAYAPAPGGYAPAPGGYGQSEYSAPPPQAGYGASYGAQRQPAYGSGGGYGASGGGRAPAPGGYSGGYADSY